MNILDRITIRAVSWQNHHQTLSEIRRIVFIDEQKVLPEEEWDEQDKDTSTHHFLVTLDNQPVGTGRILDSGKIGRLCIHKGFRGKGIGAALFQFILQFGLKQGHIHFYLNAQLTAIKLYEQFGFLCQGEVFDEAGIDHMRMGLKIDSYDQLSKIYGDQVIRFEGIEDFQFHLEQMTRFAKRGFRLLSRELNPALYCDESFNEALSHLARYSRNSDIRVLIQETRGLIGTRHSLIDLANRLSTAIRIRKTTLAPKVVDQAYVVIDARSLLFLNTEENVAGFANYEARAESKHVLEEFNYLWESHSKIEDNFRQLVM